jgi:hypothetical protein
MADYCRKMKKHHEAATPGLLNRLPAATRGHCPSAGSAGYLVTRHSMQLVAPDAEHTTGGADAGDELKNDPRPTGNCGISKRNASFLRALL